MCSSFLMKTLRRKKKIVNRINIQYVGLRNISLPSNLASLAWLAERKMNVYESPWFEVWGSRDLRELVYHFNARTGALWCLLHTLLLCLVYSAADLLYMCYYWWNVMNRALKACFIYCWLVLWYCAQKFCWVNEEWVYFLFTRFEIKLTICLISRPITWS